MDDAVRVGGRQGLRNLFDHVARGAGLERHSGGPALDQRPSFQQLHDEKRDARW